MHRFSDATRRGAASAAAPSSSALAAKSDAKTRIDRPSWRVVADHVLIVGVEGVLHPGIKLERGEDPPAPVVQALTAVSGRPPAPHAPTPRSWHLAHVAANTVFTAGLGGFAWWRFTETGDAGTLVIICIFAALFFAAATAARLVGAYYAGE